MRLSLKLQMLLILMLAQSYNKKQVAAGNLWLSFRTNYLLQRAAIPLLIVNFLQLFRQLNIFDFS